MPLETATYVADLVASNPALGDPVGQGDDHIRIIKSVLKATFPNLTSAVTATPSDLNNIAVTVASVVAAAVAVEASNRNAAVTNEATNRNTAVTLEASDRATAITTEANTRAAAITAEANARASADTALQAQITTNTNAIPTLMPFGSIQFAVAGNGCYAHIPNGTSTSFLIQAGYSGALPSGNNDGVSFPVPFPNAVLGVVVSNGTPGNLTVSGTLPGGTAAASGFLATAHVASSGAFAPGAAVYFIAMGF